MIKAIKVIWDWLSSILVAAVVVLAVALVGVRAVGLQPFAVLSGSMEPTYRVGSLIYVRSVDPGELKTGDPITYMISEDTVVTHRIVEVMTDEAEADTLYFATKGDANATPDSAAVHYKNVIGKPVFSVPYLGYLSHYIQNPPGTYLAIAGGALLLLLTFLPDLFRKETDKEKESVKS